MALSPESQLVSAWEERYGAWAEDLMRDGLETALLVPLAAHPIAALHVVRHVAHWDNHLQRKLAATLVGLVGTAAPGDMLDGLFEAEAARRRATGELFEQLTSHSVVEDIVFAATRWCRAGERRDAGLALLRKVVERTLDGEYWNTASYAVMGLVHHRAPQAAEVLERFAVFARERPPERTFVDQLAAGNATIIEEQLAGAEREAETIAWSDDARVAIEELVRLARAVTSAARS
jgi:hypothetical protein